MKILSTNVTIKALSVCCLLAHVQSAQQQEEEFDYYTSRVCYPTGEIDPAREYVPYYDLNANVDCGDTDRYPDEFAVQCGRNFYGADNTMQLNWAYGSAHSGGKENGAQGGANWIGLDKIGKSEYAPHGVMVGAFVLGEQGSLRDPHWHSNSAEFTYIISGTARITVTGLPKSDAEYTPGQQLQNTGKLRGSSRGNTQTLETMERDQETFILKPGDAFYSPVGYHHYFEGVDQNDPLVGIATFDTADLKTFDLPQMMKSLPKETLSKILDVPVEEVGEWYRGSRRVLSDPSKTWSKEGLKDKLSEDKDLRFKISGMDKNLVSAPREYTTGHVATKAMDANNYPPLEKAHFSFAFTEIAPGATMEPYFADNADQLIYVVEGEDIDVQRSGNGSDECKDTFTLREGFLAVNEINVTWMLQNKSKDKTAKILRVFNSNKPSVSTLFEAYHSLPADVVAGMLAK